MPKHVDYEIILVDDNSPDGTWRKAVELLTESITVIRRVNLKGLSTAVIDGIIFSLKEYAIVMDADLQHPPKYIESLFRKAVEEGADVVIGSRYMKGGGIEGWSKTRFLISKGAELIAKLFLPSVRGLTDPMSGFFLVKTKLVSDNRKRLNPQGFKILLEILEHCNPRKVVEVPYIFKPRIFGKSKLGSKTIVAYLIHVLKLSGWRPFKFAAVGLAGTFVNLGVLLFFKYVAPLLYDKLFILGSAIAIEISILFNFFIHETWTFRERRFGALTHRLLLFHVSSAVSAITQYISAISIKYGLSWNPLLAQFIGIIIGFPANYIISEIGIWKKKCV
jgi:dolichol-phosphate mannosyltransferase|uniref:Glycosyltransferase family 2 protein n=1 Tax=Ignisphaera aggregans TaxID=334771 RepID=A0A7J2U4B0_9CREN